MNGGMAMDWSTAKAIQTPSVPVLRSERPGEVRDAASQQPLRSSPTRHPRLVHAFWRYSPATTPPSAADYQTSLLYLSLTRRRAASPTGRFGPHGATTGTLLLAPHRGNPGGGSPMHDTASEDLRRGYSVWDRSSPPEANNSWVLLYATPGLPFSDHAERISARRRPGFRSLQPQDGRSASA